MVKKMTHIEARNFETLKLKNLLKTPSHLLKPLEFVIHQNCSCLRAKSQYEQVKFFSTKFPANFIVTMNLTF